MNKKVLPRVISNGRSSLLLMIVLTVLNLVLLMLNSNVSFPFSSYFSMFIIYVGYLAITVYDNVGIGLMYALAGVCVMAVFLTSWVLSKRNVHWFLAAFVLYLMDTLFMIWIVMGEGFDPGSIIDYAMHAWLLYSLFTAWFQGRKLRYWEESDESGLNGVVDTETIR